MMYWVLMIKLSYWKHGLGLLTIKGENLSINKLSLDTEEVIIEGEINNLSYSEKEEERKGSSSLLGKIFK